MGLEGAEQTPVADEEGRVLRLGRQLLAVPVKVLSYVACPGVRGCRGLRAAVYLPSHSFTLAMMDFCGTETPLVPREDDGAELEGFVAMLGSARECLDVVGRRRRLSWGEAEKGKRWTVVVAQKTSGKSTHVKENRRLFPMQQTAAAGPCATLIQWRHGLCVLLEDTRPFPANEQRH
ncbi:hypothetical protein G6O67_003998 [Ophiocordyceps sinensis]|uniref:Uncharacterized protein n=1 Tax=Ophiocordyceps sinensis TaxID=72228 RepID=A0A8H4LYN0_9HYPO|nr:hypothetical protein G6O67_003998 [Ophiocordyceps sinensis]